MATRTRVAPLDVVDDSIKRRPASVQSSSGVRTSESERLSAAKKRNSLMEVQSMLNSSPEPQRQSPSRTSRGSRRMSNSKQASTTRFQRRPSPRPVDASREPRLR
eukprot:2485833-Prymnesium_polylepis.1